MGIQDEVLILSATSTPRLEFAADFISTYTGVTFTIAPIHGSNHQSGNSGSYLINYTASPINGTFNIFASGVLEETEIRPLNPGVVKWADQILLFPAPKGFDLPFDLFSAVFFMLSRYEEYLPFHPDGYGRFEANQCLAFRYGFLEEPVVDQWLEILMKALSDKFPEFKFPLRSFRFISTIDVDSPWAFRHKGWWRSSAGLIKRALQFRFSELKLSLSVLTGKQPDPFDTFAYLAQIEDQYKIQSLFFFLFANYGRFDVNYALNTMAFRNLLNRLKTARTVGIHPSFASNRNVRLLKSELDQCTKLLGEKPSMSRQHYLILSLPDTYKSLIEHGISSDFSMGYASLPGFRAGTSRPFIFYDLTKERAMPLTIHPFAVMDVTLRQYLGLTPVMASERINRLLLKVRAVKGDFTSLWHNESLSEHGVWKGWREVFEGMVREGS